MTKTNTAMGGGIGGLIAALKLHRVGVSVRVCESVETIKALGVGINLLPHAVRILTDLGLEKKLQETDTYCRINLFQQIRSKDLAGAKRIGC
ncbi:hypothetical protein DCC39_12470 [Pueribacillus theae]|uniref:FAD-binding domain-containing protein n=1 Tax=Pueribacillus theae TaxID=2171751 RepID=A0A2U1JX32_9BACI|nr:FAD-dependent monooxygenase [Pueribacillus theae]PWA09770.1 hypothetical protein DCC39_12470 [Pueribacillus theae]